MGRLRREWDWYPEEDSLQRPEVIAALVAEAESGHEGLLSHQFVGRPKNPELEALRRIVLRVPAKIRNEAQKRADEQEVALSEFVAEALREHLKRLRREARRAAARAHS